MFYPGAGWIGIYWPGPYGAPTTLVEGSIASAEAWETPVLSTSVSIAPTAIASAEAWETPAAASTVELGMTSIPSAEAWGAIVVDTAAEVDPTSIPSAEAWGAIAVLPSSTIGPVTAIPSAEAWETEALATGSMAPALYPAGGYPGLYARPVSVSPVVTELGMASIPSEEAWGAVSVLASAPTTLVMTPIPSEEAWTPPLFTARAMAPGLYPGAAYPGLYARPVVPPIPPSTIGLSSIPSEEAWETAELTVGTPVTFGPVSSIASAEAWGPMFIFNATDVTLGPVSSIPSAEAWETPFGPAFTTILRFLSINSAEAWGPIGITFDPPPSQGILLPSIPSAEAWGTPRVLVGLLKTYDPTRYPRPVGLGCGVYAAAVFPRGGSTSAIIDLPVSEATWERLLDDVSSGQVVTAGLSRGCCIELGTVRPWGHELAIFRNSRKVWQGPITSKLVKGQVATLNAFDLMVWLKRRRIHADHSWTATDLAVIWNALVADGLAVGNSFGLQAVASACGVLGTRDYKATDSTIVFDALSELARTGIDFTSVARDVLVGGSTVNLDPIAYLTDDDFAEEPEVMVDGMLGANNWRVLGSGATSSDEPVMGDYGPGDPGYAALVAAYDVLEKVESEDQILDVASATAAAKTRWDLSHEPPAVLTGGRLSPYSSVTVDKLIAGRVVDVRLSRPCIPVHTRYRLGTVRAQTRAGDEQIDVTFQPVGTIEAG